MKNTHQILAISGSLRAASVNNQILEKLSTQIPATITWNSYKELKQIPAFNPDLQVLPESVERFRNQLLQADGILICTPEYVFGIPGSLKNLLDWTVGFSSGEWAEKPTALITASTSGEKAHESLQFILNVLGTQISEETSVLISNARKRWNDAAVEQQLTSVLDTLIQHIQKR
ncbi:NADPH-dependent FMN reductase [Siphonobacter sp. SORGH_AS_0500]|uniref:NADPH-dependent FMN reductase n=1 Tax=Siphonobacter sp. SORGH_AS_0500 TaxID=1864824 RepID=UPI0028674CAB|nr:NADPH-dependent FMN reductase [Siphonobacter sp. SORGH_AS_0500]MDR6194610.1 chromate reductase [Siphonobacter sp. SORGH_AS_0500]